MDAGWHKRVKELFLAARERRPEERPDYLAEACGEDAELRREVESLLNENDRQSAEAGPSQESPPAAREPAAGPRSDGLVGGTLGRYRILGVVGKGGMGTVYEAEDPKLRRKVALKVLPLAVAGDPKRLERFKREARSVAALSHPNVVTLFSVEEDGDTHFLTMELVQGEPLDRLIPKQGLDLGEILDRATQLAEGLRAAHEQGIVHRDLKPANVIVDTEGRLRILDFGLAKSQLARPTGSQAETSIALTVQGTVLGTAPYMSPEQVEGKPLDTRSDIFSLGSILYEMATGRWPFPGETLGKVMSAILGDEPTPLTRVRSDLPQGLERIVSRCLEKEPAKRYQTARELREALEELKVRPHAGTRRLAGAKWVALAAVGGVLAVVGVLLYFSWPGAEQSGLPGDNPLAGARFTKVTDFEGSEFDAAISPDGRFVAFVSDRDGPFEILVGQIGAGGFRKLASGADEFVLDDARAPLKNVGFNADGSEIWLGGASSWNRVRTLPLLGGPARNFLAENVMSVAWSPNGEHVAYFENLEGDPLYVADRNGANKRLILGPPAGTHQHYPIWSVDGEWIYLVRGWLATLEMDLWRVRPNGEGLEQLTQQKLDVGYPAPIDDRTLLYSARDADGAGPWLWAVDVETKVSRRASVGLEQYASVASSADGRRLVATVQDPRAGLWSVPILDRLAAESDVKPFADLSTTRALAPRFGGSSLFYLSSRGSGDGLWRYSEGKVAEIWRGSETALLEPAAVSPDGEAVVLLLRKNDGWRPHTLRADGTQLEVLTEVVDARGAAAWSPDGRWIVTGGYEGGVQGLFKIPVDGDGARVRIVEGEALHPVWSPDGNLIVYTGAQVDDSSPLLAVRPDGEPVELPEIDVLRRGQRARFLPDGTGLVTMRGEGPAQDFWLLDLATMKSRRLTRLDQPATTRSFDITPDGKRIVFDRFSKDSDIVLIELASPK